ADPERTQFTLVGMNSSNKNYYLNVQVEGFPSQVRAGKVAYYRTTEAENCHRIGTIPVTGPNWPVTGIDAPVPPDSIFTLTTVRDV
ncbi:MAG: hypothetical protein OEY77_16400, partial [Nitrospira sp.]|nr:hypothetical protein [Nitrospira sp.]